MNPSILENVKAKLVQGIQRALHSHTKRRDPAFHELAYQQNFFRRADSVSWLCDVPLPSPRGGTANASLLYLLLSLVATRKDLSVLELGAGLSTRLFSQYAEASSGARILTVENDVDWATRFRNRLPTNHQLVTSPLQLADYKGKQVEWYSLDKPSERFSVVLVDGPHAAGPRPNYNRSRIANWVPDILEDEYCIIVDDAERVAERYLVAELRDKLNRLQRPFYEGDLLGVNRQYLFVTETFRDLTFL